MWCTLNQISMLIYIIYVKTYDFKIVFVILTCKGDTLYDTDDTWYIASFNYNSYNKDVIICRCSGCK